MTIAVSQSALRLSHYSLSTASFGTTNVSRPGSTSNVQRQQSARIAVELVGHSGVGGDPQPAHAARRPIGQALVLAEQHRRRRTPGRATSGPRRKLHTSSSPSEPSACGAIRNPPP